MPPPDAATAAHGSRVPERRARVRISLNWPVTIRVEGERQAIMADLHDISGAGAYCVSSRRFECGENIEMEVLLPRELDSQNRGLRLVCRGSVVRSEDIRQGEHGMACVFADHMLVSADAMCRRSVCTEGAGDFAHHAGMGSAGQNSGAQAKPHEN